MADLVTHCRCGTELLVRHGATLHCTHCDNGCNNRDCGFCAQLRNTCAICVTLHKDAAGARKCEQAHK